MAKKYDRGNREKRKPKSTGPKASASPSVASPWSTRPTGTSGGKPKR